MPTATPTLEPTATPEPPPPPPEAPVTDLADGTEVSAGRMIAVSASATGADGYRWELQGDGEISATEGDAILYTAPEQVEAGGAMALLIVTAYNDGGESPQASLVINVIPPPPAIEITSPLTETVCPLDDECRFDVEGTSSAVASDPNLQAIVWVRDGDLYYPQKWVDFESDGTWQGHAQIGDRPCWPAGHEFGIVAMALTYDQVDGIAIDFQPLPQEYVARSDPVALVTTYDPVPIDLSPASSSYDEAQANVIALTTPEQSRLAFEYDLGSGGWVLVTVPMYNLDMSCMKEVGFSIAFSLEGTGAANSLEVRLEDTDFTNYGWRRPRGSVTTDLETIEVPLDHLEFWWDRDGQDTDMNWQEVMNILFAVSQHPGDEGGAGHVEISDVRLIPPATP